MVHLSDTRKKISEGKTGNDQGEFEGSTTAGSDENGWNIVFIRLEP